MLIAFNKLNVGELALSDVKDFFSSVKDQRKQNNEDIEIDEIMDVLNNN